MARIKIVTDSTADLLPEQVAKYGLTVIPLNVHFGDEVYKDGVDITPAAFYRKLGQSSIMPRTSQPSAGEFMELYRSLSADADAIISVHISGHLSGTTASAEAARGMLEELDIAVVDTLRCSQAAGRLAILASRLAAAGHSKDEIVAELTSLRTKAMIVFAPDTLEYLQKNGRIGRAQAMLGSLLQVKPILYLDKDGFVASYDKVRGKSRVIPRLVAAAADEFVPGSAVEVSVLHSEAFETASTVMEEIGRHYDVRDAQIAEIGPVVGAHIGPGAIGLVVLPYRQL